MVNENKENYKTLDWLYSRLLKREEYYAAKDKDLLNEYKEKVTSFSSLSYDKKKAELLDLCVRNLVVDYIGYGDDFRFDEEVEACLDEDEDVYSIGNELHDIEIMISERIASMQKDTLKSNLDYLLDLETDAWIKVSIFEGTLSIGYEIDGKSEERNGITIEDFISLYELDLEEYDNFIKKEFKEDIVTDEMLDGFLNDFIFGKYWDSQKNLLNRKK